MVPVAKEMKESFRGQSGYVVNVHGDALGAVILLGQEEISPMEITLVHTTAEFLGSIMED